MWNTWLCVPHALLVQFNMIPDIEWLYYLLHQAPAFPLPSCKSHSTGKAMKGGSCLCLAFPGPWQRNDATRPKSVVR